MGFPRPFARVAPLEGWPRDVLSEAAKAPRGSASPSYLSRSSTEKSSPLLYAGSFQPSSS